MHTCFACMGLHEDRAKVDEMTILKYVKACASMYYILRNPCGIQNGSQTSVMNHIKLAHMEVYPTISIKITHPTL